MNNQQITIEQVTSFSESVADAVRFLAQQLGKNYKPLANHELIDMIQSPNTFLFLAKTQTGEYVGMITLLVFRIPYLKKGYIDDVVVDESFRGLGIANQLMQTAIDRAKEENVSYIDLTAKPEREAGHNLYEKFGFQKRNTLVFRLDINYDQH